LIKGVNKGYETLTQNNEKRNFKMSMTDIITQKLTQSLAPEALEVINESDMHAGHAGSPGTGESHFRIKITASKFEGQSRLYMHQTINKILSDELKNTIHALAIEAKAS